MTSKSKRKLRSYLMMYMRPVRIECERFLKCACCHQHAFEVWSTWSYLRDHVVPAIESCTFDPKYINLPSLLEFNAQVLELNEKVKKASEYVDGRILDQMIIDNPKRSQQDLFTLFLSVPSKMVINRHTPQARKTESLFNIKALGGVQ